MALSGMLAEVDKPRIRGLLEQRDPAILDEDPEQLEKFEDRVRGAAAQVVLLTGSDPVAGPIRDLAVEAIALQTASAIEYAEYPEQQTAGDTGRGYHLHQRYLELLAELRGIIGNAGGIPADGGVGGIPTGLGLPRGRFPAPSTYPDPLVVPGVEPDRRRYYPC